MIWILLYIGINSPAVTVDRIEINTHPSGFTQVILWEWEPDYCRWDVSQWMIDDFHLIKKQDYWHVKIKGTEYKTKLLEITKTLLDPERLNRRLRPAKTRNKYPAWKQEPNIYRSGCQ